MTEASAMTHSACNDVARVISETEVSIDAIVLLYERDADDSYILARAVVTDHLLRPADDGWKVAYRKSTPLHGPPPARP